MKRAAPLLALLLLPALCPAQGPAAAPPTPAAAAQLEARRAELLAETKALAAQLHERAVCTLVPANARGLPSFRSDSRGTLSLDATAQVDLSSYRAWAAELTPLLRRLAQSVEPVRLVKEKAGYRFELPGREFDASQLVVVDGFADIPRSLSAHVYSFDIATASEICAAFRQPRDRKYQTVVLLQFRGESGPIASVRQGFSLVASPGVVAPFVEARVRYQRFGTGAKAEKFPVLSFRSRRPVRFSLAKLDPSSLRAMTKAWTVCLPEQTADAVAKDPSETGALFRDVRGRVVHPRRAATAAAAPESAAERPAAAVSASEEEARRRAAAARELRRRAEAATAGSVRASAEAFFAAVRGGSRGKPAAAAIEAFEREDLSVACVEAAREHPESPDLQVSGEAYLASQLWAKWRMRAKVDGAGAIVPGEPSWSLAPSFQPPEYIRGASRINPFPELSLEDPGSEPVPDGPPPADPFPFGALLIALGAFALLAGTVVLLWIERLRRKAEESPDSAG